MDGPPRARPSTVLGELRWSCRCARARAAKALAHRGNVTKAAAAAALSGKHLYELMRKVGLFATDEDE
jgi:hypothetical protein